jgi:hypothetical protein
MASRAFPLSGIPHVERAHSGLIASVAGAQAVATARSASRAQQSVLVFSRALLTVLAGYALLDHGFAWVHIPATPVFVGEAVLIIGAGVAVFATGTIRHVGRQGLPIILVLAFVVWGVARTVPMIRTYGIDALRDSALWYYSLIAVLVAAALSARPELFRRWAKAYVWFIPLLLLWGPFAVLLADHTGEPLVPFSQVSVLSHKVGNISVAVASALAFLWLVPTLHVQPRVRFALTALGLLVIGMAATQNRGGLVAAGAALLLVVLLTRRPMRLVMTLVVTTLCAVLATTTLGLSVGGAQGRDVSAGQLVQNVVSIFSGSQDTSQLSTTVSFRNELWAGVIDDAERNNALVTGLGFGPNLALELGLQGQNTADPLRSPHNSHVDVLARMGLIGAGLWLALWLVWAGAVLRARGRFRIQGRRFEQGLSEFSLVGVVAILVNAYFDPTLEGAQVALWLWTLFGMGVVLATLAKTRGTVPVSG